METPRKQFTQTKPRNQPEFPNCVIEFPSERHCSHCNCSITSPLDYSTRERERERETEIRAGRQEGRRFSEASLSHRRVKGTCVEQVCAAKQLPSFPWCAVPNCQSYDYLEFTYYSTWCQTKYTPTPTIGVSGKIFEVVCMVTTQQVNSAFKVSGFFWGAGFNAHNMEFFSLLLRPSEFLLKK
jgi:hypothetical protein